MHQQRLASHINTIASEVVKVARIIALPTTSNAISWNGKDKSFSAFSSDLQWSLQDKIILTNPKTEGTETFSNPVPYRDRENEVQWWTLTGESNPKITFKIFND